MPELLIPTEEHVTKFLQSHLHKIKALRNKENADDLEAGGSHEYGKRYTIHFHLVLTMSPGCCSLAAA